MTTVERARLQAKLERLEERADSQPHVSQAVQDEIDALEKELLL